MLQRRLDEATQKAAQPLLPLDAARWRAALLAPPKVRVRVRLA